jgi:hypothetical protein
MEVVEVVAPTAVPPVDAKELVLKMLDEAEAKEKTCAEKICAGIKAVGLASKDLHYRAKGEAFYSEHLLADLGWQIERLTDEFIEVYYLGDKGWDPPLMGQVYCMANTWLLDNGGIPPEGDEASTDYWARRLLRVCEDLVSQVEVAKDVLTKKAGTQAVLDEISKQVLQVIGLLKRNLK